MKQNKKHCHFCVNSINQIDYKETELLRKFLSPYERILPKRTKNTCSKHQRKLNKAIKLARIMALLPFVRK
ncbi:30S ribosomal protein S18 [Patescibacteria group bacterium]|nr:30S ribosomal protein S18 [Patescibacteria group bacterium]